MVLLVKTAIATIRKAQGVPIFVIIERMDNEKIRPPIPEPATVIPAATLRFC
jgi:hypothetical protein